MVSLMCHQDERNLKCPTLEEVEGLLALAEVNDRTHGNQRTEEEEELALTAARLTRSEGWKGQSPRTMLETPKEQRMQKQGKRRH